ncbi:PIR protein [Plasmodium vivax]|nr:PIR protein [Plasmodium vivax]
MSEKKTYKTHEFLGTFKRNFNSYKFYNHFKININDSYDYYKKCNSTASVGSNNRCHTIKQITKKWKEKFDTFTSVDNNIIQKCDLLVLWIYDKIIGCNSDNYCASWYYGLLENFWYESSCCEKYTIEKTNKVICKNKFIKTFKLDVLMNKRDSYDFFEYCEYVKNILSPSYQIKEKYCEYIKYILKLYHELKDEGRQGGFPHIYKKELDLYKNTIGKDDTLSILKKNCNIDDSFTKVPRSVDNLNLLQRKHEKKLTKLPVTPYYGQYNQTIKNEYENIIEELPSSKIYEELTKGASGDEYESKHCNNLKDDKYQMKKICKKMVRNIKTLSNNSEMKGLSHRDRCTYLNFWIYGEISKLQTNKDRNLTDITDVFNLIDANIKINMDLINDYSNKKNHQTAQSTNRTSSQSPSTSVKNHELSKHEPCYFNYDCTFSECKEMKHLFEYFKNYDEIKKKINCEKKTDDKYYAYLKYMSYLYNKHKYEVECCSWGAEICPDYFLECDEYYDPRKLISVIESSDTKTCNNIKNSLIANKSEETSTIDPKEENNMYIKYFTCSYINDSNFKNKGLRCYQPQFNALRRNKFAAVRPVYKSQTSNSQLRGKKLTINGKSINAVLISDPNAIITGETNPHTSELENYYTLFPEIRGAARKAYVKQGEEACKNGEIKEGMEEYCRKSKRYNKIINLSNSQSANVTLEKDIENWEDIVIPDDTSFLNEILQQLPVRMGAVSLASLGAVTMLFMYYKFTPLGSWLRNAMGGKKKMKHDNHGEPRKSLNYQQDHMPQISQKKRIKIAYQSS